MPYYDDIGENFLLKFTKALAKVSDTPIFSQDEGVIYEVGKDYEKQVETMNLEQFRNLKLTEYIHSVGGFEGRSRFTVQKEILNEDYMVFVNSKRKTL